MFLRPVPANPIWNLLVAAEISLSMPFTTRNSAILGSHSLQYIYICLLLDPPYVFLASSSIFGVVLFLELLWELFSLYKPPTHEEDCFLKILRVYD